MADEGVGVQAVADAFGIPAYLITGRGRSRLADIAPRLARARDAWEQEIADARQYRRWRRRRWLELERLVSHRDLQLVRAYNTGNGKYIRERQRKLESAKRMLRQFEASGQ